MKKIQYESKLSIIETQKAIKYVKDVFQKQLAKSLKLLRVSAPLFVLKSTGLNDNLSGKETPVSFNTNNFDDAIEIVQSLAKWKRMALNKYDINFHEGLYTDMNAIRKDEKTDFIHSLYVDQWDWEIKISDKDRNVEYLKKVVRKVYKCIYDLSIKINKKYSNIVHDLAKDIYFISTSELEKMFPDLSRKEREDQITRMHKAVFLYQIGFELSDGLSHDSRAADYDDWNLNGDILLYYPLYDMSLEISSMGIRVDSISLLKQLKVKNELYKIENDYCKSILNKTIPLSIGGGIGQSRLCMFMLNKAHIGEVQVSLWDDKETQKAKENNIFLL